MAQIVDRKPSNEKVDVDCRCGVAHRLFAWGDRAIGATGRACRVRSLHSAVARPRGAGHKSAEIGTGDHWRSNPRSGPDRASDVQFTERCFIAGLLHRDPAGKAGDSVMFQAASLAFRRILGVGLYERGLALPVQLAHERISGGLILEFP